MLLSLSDTHRLQSWVTEVACQYAEPEDSLRDTADIVAILAAVKLPSAITDDDVVSAAVPAATTAVRISSGERYARVFALATTLAELFAARRNDGPTDATLITPADSWLGEFRHACANMHAALTT
jgi:hypothetical protein